MSPEAKAVLEDIRRVVQACGMQRPRPRRIILGELDYAELCASAKIAEGPAPSVYTVPILVLPMPRVPEKYRYDYGQIPMPGDALAPMPLSAEGDA